MPPTILPAAVQSAFYIAGVVPVFLAGVNREAWLSTSVKVGGNALLIIDAGVSPARLEAIADEVLCAAAEHCRMG